MERYKVMEHTADLMVKATGSTLEECFGNAAYSLFDQTVDMSNIRPLDSVHVEVRGDDLDDRLFSFLSELLFIEDCDGMILCEFDVRFEDDRVICDARGEPLNLAVHRTKSEIKAVTYHMMSVDPEEPSVTVIFDV